MDSGGLVSRGTGFVRPKALPRRPRAKPGAQNRLGGRILLEPLLQRLLREYINQDEIRAMDFDPLTTGNFRSKLPYAITIIFD
jgi:hypothetical protein